MACPSCQGMGGCRVCGSGYDYNVYEQPEFDYKDSGYSTLEGGHEDEIYDPHNRFSLLNHHEGGKGKKACKDKKCDCPDCKKEKPWLAQSIDKFFQAIFKFIKQAFKDNRSAQFAMLTIASGFFLVVCIYYAITAGGSDYAEAPGNTIGAARINQTKYAGGPEYEVYQVENKEYRYMKPDFNREAKKYYESPSIFQRIFCFAGLARSKYCTPN